MATLGAININTRDYSGIRIEEFGYHNAGSPCWAVPGWMEDTYPEMCGPFASADEALVVCHALGFEPSVDCA